MAPISTLVRKSESNRRGQWFRIVHDLGKVGRTGEGAGQRIGLGGNDSPGRTGRGDGSVLIMRGTMRQPVDERRLGEHRRQSRSGQSGADAALAAA